MRQGIVLAAVVAVVVLVASPAQAGQNAGPSLRSLQKQLTALQKQVTTLKKRVARDENYITVSLAYSVCSTAVTADTFQDTFTGLDTRITTPGYFGAQTPVNDYQACSVFSVVRAHNQSPPNTNILRALLDVFKPRSFASLTGLAAVEGLGR